MAELDITLGEYNIELAKIGFKKRLPNELYFIGTENGAMNKYMAYSLNRMNKKLRENKREQY